eukprot:Colp12_sorted_trinity150504_noHs@36202
MNRFVNRLLPIRSFPVAKVLGSNSHLMTSRLLTRSALPLHMLKRTFLLTRHLATFGNRPSLTSRTSEFPDVVRQWHPSKNTVSTDDVTPFSRKKFWFVCDDGHEWETALQNRTQKGSGCPTCNIRRATSTNNLLSKYPAVAAEWHPTKNGELQPENVSNASKTKVWWQCKDGHEWKSEVCKRKLSTGCPQCALERQRGAPKGRQSLFAAHPDLAQQWHPTKNGVLTPDAVSRATKKKVWWQCPSDPAHEWEAPVSARSVQHTGCPFCKKSPRPLSETNNLLALYPEVAQEWHPSLNGELTADKVTGKSCKKVWWACKGCGHEWQARVDSAAEGSGCPKCARQKKNENKLGKSIA